MKRRTAQNAPAMRSALFTRNHFYGILKATVKGIVKTAFGGMEMDLKTALAETIAKAAGMEAPQVAGL